MKLDLTDTRVLRGVHDMHVGDEASSVRRGLLRPCEAGPMPGDPGLELDFESSNQ
jgi:hypothetical protein